MKKKVYLITNYFHFASEKASNRYRELAEMLSRESDIELEVITSAFYQRTKKFRENQEELASGVPYKVTFIYEPGYQKNVSLGRLKTSRVFAKNTLKYIKSQPKPALIYQVVPTLDVASSVGKFANDNGIPFVLDVQDLWPEAFKMALNIPVVSDILFAPYTALANKAYKSADAVCAVSKTYVERVLSVNKKCDSGHPVFIGINLAVFDENAKGAEKAGDRVKLAYCGSLSESYDIKLVIDALALLENPPLFVVMGDGSSKQNFENYAKEKNVEAEFIGYLPYSDMCRELCSCDITINPIIGSSVATIINKHGDYAACGLPVINTQRSEEYCELVEDYEMGFNSVSGDASELAEKIRILTEDEALRRRMGENSRRCAEEKFDRRNTYKELVEVIKGLI
ncbi:MAG: glycosyltransferase family 4 protein [Clostridia bacterium]|nr:glycosyltransferase family 4 protein [Clostridia bacterium]